jgi:hypothetical protein
MTRTWTLDTYLTIVIVQPVVEYGHAHYTIVVGDLSCQTPAYKRVGFVDARSPELLQYLP